MTVLAPRDAAAARRRGPAVVTMAIGAGVTVIGSLLPWVRTGGARRNSYDLFSLVDRLGFAPDGPVGAALRWWPLMPLLATVGVVAAWWGLVRVGGGLGLIAAGYSGAVAVAITRAPSNLVRVELGAAVTVGGALVLAGGAIAALVVGWRDGQRRTVSSMPPGS
jgi:hypothetical protein